MQKRIYFATCHLGRRIVHSILALCSVYSVLIDLSRGADLLPAGAGVTIQTRGEAQFPDTRSLWSPLKGTLSDDITLQATAFLFCRFKGRIFQAKLTPRLCTVGIRHAGGSGL